MQQRVDVPHGSCLSTLGPHDHPCLIYENPDEQADAYVPYLYAGMAQGELCVYVVDETHPEFIRSAFRSRNVDIDKFEKSGAFRIITKHNAYLTGGYFDTAKMMQFWRDTVDEALRNKFTAVRAAAEMTWALGDEPGVDMLVPYESELNDVFPQLKVSALCQYDRKRFGSDVIKDMVHIHPLVVVDGQILQNPTAMSHHEFIKSRGDLEVTRLLDTIALANRLQQRNAELEEAIAANHRAQNEIAEVKRLQVQLERAVEKERQLRYYAEDVRALNDEMHSLAKIVSHELQEPIAKIRSYLSLLSVRYKGQLGKDADEFIDICTDSAKVVHRMIDDLWLFARMTKTNDSEITVVSAGAVVAGLLHEYKDTLKNFEAEVIVGELPRLSYSERQLTYIFDALLNNAITYRRSGLPPRIKIEAELIKPDEWVFAVSDNGIGIDPMYYRDIFRAFYRINSSPGEKGTGMGLSICQKIAQARGGRIWVESTLGQGSTFFFTVPAVELPAQN